LDSLFTADPHISFPHISIPLLLPFDRNEVDMCEVLKCSFDVISPDEIRKVVDDLSAKKEAMSNVLTELDSLHQEHADSEVQPCPQ